MRHAPLMTDGTDGTPTSPAYPYGPPGADIELHDGPLMVNGRPGTGRIWLGTRGGLDHRWEALLDDQRSLALGDAVLAFDHSRLGPVTVDARVTSTAGRGVLLSPDLGPGGDLDEAVVHWVALPRLPESTRLATRQAVWAGRCELTGGGWDMTVDARRDHEQTADMASGTPDLAITHTGLLRRTDRSTFTPDQAQDALHGWQTVFSFALGRWVAPALATGSRAGRPSWELWAEWRQSDWYRPYAWWDTDDRAGLDEISRLLLAAWSDPARRDTARHVAHHVIEANEGRTTLEARIMLIGAALEYLSWDTHVLRGGRSKGKHRDRTAAENLRELLEAARISTGVPAGLDDLERLRADKDLSGAPETVAWLRNRLVHPTDANEPYRLQHLVLQAWQLLTENGELLLLHDLGYKGLRNPRHPLGRWAHDSSLVPWAAPPPLPGPAVPGP